MIDVVGLTGGIACGKSLIGEYLRDLGVTVIDADQLSRRVMAPGERCLGDVLREFGDHLLVDGVLDRRALGAIVFADPDKLRRLEALTHPAIEALLSREIDAADSIQAGERFVVYENAILFETGADKRCSTIVVAHVPPQVQVERVIKRNGLTREAAEARLAAQMSQAVKVARADFVVDTSGTKDELRRSVTVLKNALARVSCSQRKLAAC